METIVVLAENGTKEKLKECFAQLLVVVEAESEWHLPYLVRDLRPHAVILDTTHPARQPEKIIEEISLIDPDLPVIAIIASGAARPVSLIVKGIFNTISFPCSQDELIWVVQQALETYTLRKLAPKVKVRSQEAASALLFH